MAVVVLPASLDDLRPMQANVVTRAQALERGKAQHEIAVLVRSGHWQRLHPGVFYTYNNPPPRKAQLWGVVLRIGRGAVLSHVTAAEVWKFADQASEFIHVSVPRTAGTLAVPAGVHLHYSSRLPNAEFGPALAYSMPPVTRAEEAVLDLAGSAVTAEEAVTWAIRACQRRKTTPEMIGMVMLEPGHRQLRWRDDLRDALTAIRAGVQSPLELRYLQNVEQAHGLPEGRRQVKTRRGTAIQYHDVRYTAFGVGVELDGVAYHSADARDRDDVRDNSSTLDMIRTLRYGWRLVAYHPCAVAHQVWSLLVHCGYGTDFHRCGESCAAPAKPATAHEVLERAAARARA